MRSFALPACHRLHADGKRLRGSSRHSGCPPLEVHADHGAVRGQWHDDGSAVLRTIPLAAPPLGALRWRPPGACQDRCRLIHAAF